MAGSPAIGTANLLAQKYQPLGGRSDVLLQRRTGQLRHQTGEREALRDQEIL
jgi:hypothetical protein